MKLLKDKRFFQINLGAFLFSLVLACIGMEIVFILIGTLLILITIFGPSISEVIPMILALIALILAIISWGIIFKKSYKYLEADFNEMYKPSRKKSILIILLIVFKVIWHECESCFLGRRHCRTGIPGLAD
jgi:hypothetical protein